MSRRALRAAWATVIGAALAVPTAAGPVAAATTQTPATVVPAVSSVSGRSVVVMAQAGREAAVERAARALGLTITRSLDLVHGFAASGPTAAVQRLRAVPGVVSVTPDRPVRPMTYDPVLGYDPSNVSSSSSITQLVGAQDAWVKGYTGKGVDVAVIDTGVTPVPGLDDAGKVFTGPDLSFDAPSSTTPGLDLYGHGTFMAGLIAGRDASTVTGKKCPLCLNSSLYSDPGRFTGVAPDARIIDVKVGASDGAADVSQVIAAIDWVVQHAKDPGFNIKVLNLSFGADSNQSYLIDPLAFAAEQAWRHGIVVVASAGNEGRTHDELASPAYDPFVIAVGGLDSHGTMMRDDDSVAEFAQNGTVVRPVDVVAPGVSTIGVRVPGSFVDTLPDNVGKVGTRFQRGSGTSQAAAIVSGVAALVVQKYPRATPDQLKALITSTATSLRPIVVTDQLKEEAKALGMSVDDYVALLTWRNRTYGGYGVPSAMAALSQSPSSTAKQYYLPSLGGGSLEATRGGVHVVNAAGVPLTGELDIFGTSFVSSTMASAEASATAWDGGIWNGSRWSGDAWSGSRWSTAEWTGTDWSGSRWSGSRWSGSDWSGAEWSGSRWSGAGWQ